MKINFWDDLSDIFAIDKDHVAYDEDGNVYMVYVSEKSFVFGMCLGKVRCVLTDDLQIKTTFLPLTSYSSGYTLITIEELKKKHDLYSKLIQKL